jgi:D-alanine-D-alanine ligase
MTKMKRLRVALLIGGVSNEREISLKSGSEVKKALNPERYHVSIYDLKEGLAPLVADASRIDVALIILHGRFGEDGTVQGLLELLGIPYQGSGVLGSALAMNKRLTKAIYRLEGLPVARDCIIRQGDRLDLNSVVQELGWPMVIKPNREGSSIGVQLADNKKKLSEAVKQTFLIDQEVLIEEFVQGREITAGVLGNQTLQALPIVEVIPTESYKFFDFEAKYKEKATREICPADLPAEVARRAQEYALLAHKALNLRGYSRTDMIVRGEEVILLETNTIPGFTQTSLFPLAARVAGIDFSTLLDRLIELALEDPGKKK